MKRNAIITLLTSIILLIITSCVTTNTFRSNYTDANSLLHESNNLVEKKFLKAHLKNRDVLILKNKWGIDTISNTLSGIGTRYDFNRKAIYNGALKIPLDSVAIFETNAKLTTSEHSRIIGLSIMGGLDAILGIYCLTRPDPKTCFGSCPTFYINENDNFHYSDAEGFSNAIAPSMEYFDIDALKPMLIQGKDFSITMKNEALETHCIKDVKLLAYPIKDGQRVFHSPSNKFYLCENTYPLTYGQANEGDITHFLKESDQSERFSYADSQNLSSKEEIYLTFKNIEDKENLGLILNFRQTLMTTYFIYSAMGYMGDEVGDYFAKIETNDNINSKVRSGIYSELGNIDVYAWDENKNKWIFLEGFNETGPIAINKQLIQIKNLPFSSEIRLKIELNKGLWRIDYAGITNIKKQIEPFSILPSSVFNKGEFDKDALISLNSPKKYLISMPGSEYKINFEMPTPDTNYELFLYSKGYYLEWMRKHWIKEKNIPKLNQMLIKPKSYLKDEAKEFKKYETSMEQLFWESKINTKTFYYGTN